MSKSDKCYTCGKEGSIFRGNSLPRLYIRSITLMRIIKDNNIESDSSFTGIFCHRCKRKFDKLRLRNIEYLAKQRIDSIKKMFVMSETGKEEIL